MSALKLKRGSFITVEGIEGSGKSLQLQLISEELERRGIPCVTTLEPGGTEFGRELRAILLRTDGPKREPIAELLLYLADRYQHLREIVEPALDRGLFVLSDRYHDATVVYQGFARSIGIDRIQRLARVLGLRTPDLTIVFDIEVETGLRRARERNRLNDVQHQGRFESESLEFHRRVQQGYQLLVEREPERVVMVDASGTPDEVFGRVRRILDERL
jgi:dTMP kinase